MAEKNENDNGLSGLAVKIAEKANKIKYVILAVVVVLIAAMIIVSQLRRQKNARETEAEAALFRSEIDLVAKPDTDVQAVFGKAAKDYEGLPAGARALIIQFSNAFNTRNYAAAEQAAREFIRAYPKNIMANRAQFALAQAVFMQDKTADAVKLFREIVASADPELFPEAKLALAQALEREAEAAKDNPDEYRRKLEAAETEYNDIVARSQITVPSQRGFWPPSVTLPASFSLAIVRDKLAGHQHPAPLGAGLAAPAAAAGVMATPPPPAEANPEAEAAAPAAPPAEKAEPAAEKTEAAAGGETTEKPAEAGK